MDNYHSRTVARWRRDRFVWLKSPDSLLYYIAKRNETKKTIPEWREKEKRQLEYNAGVVVVVVVDIIRYSLTVWARDAMAGAPFFIVLYYVDKAYV